ncbi:uncharacterized protein MELLADRAFT_71440 [Melampsora larici-populina 98AG31]|uniref:Phospho-2-dehydro-3-deoxyheptonate aldolase n=1 Tax=Melampsora larici-populina (strain 98AG31 / pathotype 3-4-7) TaxID=747676 RepID=F4RG40_MELLP|nr:uncharacterized protein MELLADRAFT_71440 [Melampsora larici-populina 98AG31]EGG08609.1 hypothetical protein MELLADRAFT_71440 [Melampsora larici-populina 98AG31]
MLLMPEDGPPVSPFRAQQLVADIKAAAASERPRAQAQAMNELDDNRIREIRPLVPPQIIIEELPLSETAAQTILQARKTCESIIKGSDDRLIVIVGPCSIHDVNAAIEYGQKLKELIPKFEKELLIIMRVYFEKPRTTVGWKGLINDPFMDTTFNINKGLRVARGLLLDLNDLGLPAAVEFLDTISPQYIADLVSWGAIGARTTESQVHRELASGISAPVGFKNGTNGGVAIAIDAIRAASAGHHFLSVTKQGLSAIVSTNGNDACHVILRGSTDGPNYSAQHVESCSAQLSKAGLRPSVMIDCSHGNSQKQFARQVVVAEDISTQLASGKTAQNIMGVMIESHLKEGRQDIPAEGPSGLVYGQSITDACISFETTIKVLETLAEGVRQRRATQA